MGCPNIAYLQLFTFPLYSPNTALSISSALQSDKPNQAWNLVSDVDLRLSQDAPFDDFQTPSRSRSRTPAAPCLVCSSSSSTISSEIPPSGETIVTVNYDAKSENQAGANGALGSITTERAPTATRSTRYNESLELAVDAAGKMVVKKESKVENKHYENKASGFTNFFAEVNGTFDKFKGLDYEGCTFEGLKIAELQDFIFSGNETFAFKGFHFSDNQDLICSITYADPS
ncbi:hypothetical protein QBC37DRAFT_448137 [Rhypophila decipiens]|uniref:Uncharacterized protein n=1 Tax=Rhypophila decipiens TaxID=261697 RepID=A0AAN6YKA0_9PEZI|nr:hypothetical protein QBC37DRAFT_448137 [Rhypophila decipiens]